MENRLQNGFVCIPLEEYDDMQNYSRAIDKRVTELEKGLDNLKEALKDAVIKQMDISEKCNPIYSIAYLCDICEAFGIDAEKFVASVMEDRKCES